MRARWMAVIGLGLLAAQADAKGKSPTTQEEKASYALGVTVAKNIRRQGVEVNADALSQGLRDGLSGQKLRLSDEELRAAMDGVMAEAKRKQREAAVARKNRKAAGEAFRAENAKKAGVVTLASGVQYKVLEAGGGRTPTEADTVECHYRGTTIDGQELDSSYKRGKPARITMAQAVPRWKEILKLMPVGSKWQVVFPPEAASRSRRASKKRHSDQGETLVFEIQLVGVAPSPQTTEKATAAADHPS